MKKYIVYEVPGIKIGCTSRWPQRVIEQGHKEEDCKVLFETDVLELASSMERVLQKKHDYKVDTARYSTTIKALADIAADPIRAAAKSEACSKAAVKAQAEIAADTVRAASKREACSKAAFKANAEISADPVRAASKSAKLSRAQSKVQAEISADPVRSVSRSANMSKAALKANAELAADPIRAASKSKACSVPKLKTTYQIDPKTGYTICTYESNYAAGISVGLKCGANISTAKKTGKIVKGFRWI